jgi:hypothetical protein
MDKLIVTFICSYVTEDQAWQLGLVYITSDNKVIMKGDNTSWLAAGQYRNRCDHSTLMAALAKAFSASGFRVMQCTIQVFLYST